MSRLIDADKIDFNEVFVGASEFAQDTRNAAQMLIDNQPTAFDIDKVLNQLEKVRDRYSKLIFAFNDVDEARKYMETECAIKIAIEIVKAGYFE